jgi:hypothetical protein
MDAVGPRVDVACVCYCEYHSGLSANDSQAHFFLLVRSVSRLLDCYRFQLIHSHRSIASSLLCEVAARFLLLSLRRWRPT